MPTTRSHSCFYELLTVPQELKVGVKVLVPLMRDQLFNVYSSSVTRAIQCANIVFDRRAFIHHFFRSSILGDPEVTFNMASAAATFLSKCCAAGSFVATKQAVFNLVDCLSLMSSSQSPVVDIPVQIWVLDAIVPDLLIPSYVVVGKEAKICFPHCGWCDVMLGDHGMLRMSPACGLVLECIVGSPSTLPEICHRTLLSSYVTHDALLHLQNESLIVCDGVSYRISPAIDLQKPCPDSHFRFVARSQPSCCLLPLGKDFVSAATGIAQYCRSYKAVEEVVLFQALTAQGHHPSNVAFALSEMAASGAIFRVGCILIENLENFSEASRLHDDTIRKLSLSVISDIGSRTVGSIVKKLVLVTPPASATAPPFPSTSSVFSGFNLDSQQMEDLAAESLFAAAELSRTDVLDVANSLLMCNDGNFISAIVSANKVPLTDVEFSAHAAASCAERCPVGLCTPSGSYKPLLLPCGHGACAECWQSLLEHALQTSSTPVVRSGQDISGIRTINCIKCPADTSNKCAYKMKLTDVQSCVPQLASSFRNSVKRWFIRTIASGSFPMAACSCGASVFGRSMDSEVECKCGRISTVGDIKLAGRTLHWRPHPYSSCNTEHEWRLLSTHGSSERIALMRTKKCPGCLIDTTKCGCEASNVMCNGLDRCPNEACNHLICQKCKLDWCWICRKPGCHGCDQSSNSSDLKERFNEGSRVVSKLDAALVPSYISRFVLDDSQGGAVKIVSVVSDAPGSSLPLNTGDLFTSINGIPVHNIASLMDAAMLEHAAHSSVLIGYRRKGELLSCWHNCEEMPSGFSADAIVFKRSLYIHSIIRPHAQPLPPMQRLQRLCDIFVSLHARAASQRQEGNGGSLKLAIDAANSDDVMKYALQFQHELSSEEAALMMFLRQTSSESGRAAD